MAYVVGLIATDGCLLTRRRRVNFKSIDRDLVETFARLTGLVDRVRMQRTALGRAVYFIEFGDVEFYQWLQSVGLMPKKSLVLTEIAVPDEFFFPLLRGLFDGDGCIQNFVHQPTPTTYPSYSYERLWLFFNSASRRHLEWIANRVQALAEVAGYLETRAARPGRHAFYRLKFGKHASIALLRLMYPDRHVPKLERKWKVWAEYEARNLAT